MKEKFHLLVAFLSLSILFGNALAQGFTCDEDLIADDNPNIAYTKRGNRCEGFYQPPVSGGGLQLVSLLHGELRFDPDETKYLYISLPSMLEQSVHVQAVGIPLNIYYRLDALLEPGRIFKWPLEIVKGELRDDQIGLFGRLKNEKDIYVPLTVTDCKAASSAPLNLIFRSSGDVSMMKWMKYAMPEKECEQSLSEWKEIPRPLTGFISGHPIELPDLSTQNENFCIEIRAAKIDFNDCKKNSDNCQNLRVKIRMKG